MILLSFISCSAQLGSSVPNDYSLVESHDIENHPKHYDIVFNLCLKTPCVFELWKHPEREIRLLRSGNNIMLIDDSYNVYSKWPADWSRINGPLRYCIGDILGHEKYGFKNGEINRSKTLTQNWYWHLTFETPNACNLRGVLKINATGPEINTDMLSVSGISWKQGGSELLEHIFAAERSGWVKEELRLEKIVPSSVAPQ